MFMEAKQSMQYKQLLPQAGQLKGQLNELLEQHLQSNAQPTMFAQLTYNVPIKIVGNIP